MIIFPTRSHPHLARSLARVCKAKLGVVSFRRFSDGELSVQVKAAGVRAPLIVFGALNQPNENLLEILLLLNALWHASRHKASAVIPYLGYARSDRSEPLGTAVSAQVVAKCLVAAPASQVITLDAHSPLISRYFKIPFKNLSALPLFAIPLVREKLHQLVFVAPDQGARQRAASLAKLLGAKKIAVVLKKRLRTGLVRALSLKGEVRGKDVCLVDDMIDSGGTMIAAARLLKAKGAGRLVAVATHGIWSGRQFGKLKQAGIEKIYVTDSLPQPRLPGFIYPLSCAKILAQGIEEY